MFTNLTSNLSSNVSSWIPSSLSSLRKGEEPKKEGEETLGKPEPEEVIPVTAVDTSKDAVVEPKVATPPAEEQPIVSGEENQAGGANILPGIPGIPGIEGAYQSVQGVATNAYQSVEGATSNAYQSVAGASTNAYQSVAGASTNAIQSAKTFGSFLFTVGNKVGKSVTDTAKQVKHVVEENSFLGEFNREQQEFANQQGESTEPAIPPWVGFPEEEVLKQQIIGLSQDRRNFVRNPPAGVDFQFDYNTIYPIAMATLKEDPNLEKMRFELVPKVVNEETFWRNYFYRVSLIKQSTQLSLTHEAGGNDSDKSSRTGSGDGSPKEEAWERELQQELQEYEVVNNGDNNPADDADWEKEVQQLLEADKS